MSTQILSVDIICFSFLTTHLMAPGPKLRHAGDTGYQRGDETRARIITAALKIFGERGFASASTREIAAAAGVNPPALQYYFNNKEGVYLACAEHVVRRVSDAVAAALSDAKAVLDRPGDDAALIDAFCAIQMALVSLMTPSANSTETRLFMAREQAGLGPGLGSDLFYERMSKPIADVTTAIIGRLLGKSPDDDETILQNTALTGQIALFQMLRHRQMSRMDWDTNTSDRIQLIGKIVMEHTSTLLRAMAAARPR